MNKIQSDRPSRPMRQDAAQQALSAQDLQEDRGFVRALLKLSAPMAAQSLISALVSYADVLMMAGVNDAALAAVSLAGRITFVLTLLYMGLTTGLCILAAQYWGRRDTAVVAQVTGLALKLSLPASALFAAAALALPQALMRLFTADAQVAAYGVIYLRAVSLGYLLMGISQPLLAAMKSTEQTTSCAAISSGCLLCNVALNALAVLWLLRGNASACVAGVAVATTLSRGAEAALCLWWNARRSKARVRPAHVRHTPAWLWRDFGRCTAQVQANYLIWGGALTAMSAIVGHVGTQMASAYSVAGAVRDLAIVACSGVAAGGTVMMGKYLGAGRMALAKRCGQRLCRWSLGLGVGACALVLLAAPLCMRIVALEGDAAQILAQMLPVCAVYCVGKSFNSMLVGGVFCAGGDTQFGPVCDAVCMWGVALPLAWLAAFVWRVPPVWLYVLLCADELIKLPFVALHYRQYRWLRDLTRNETEAEEHDHS